MEWSGAPEKVTIDKSGSNMAALYSVNAGRRKPSLIRQAKYPNNIVEQDQILLSGIELMHMIKEGQMRGSRKRTTPAEQFYALAA